MGCAIGLDIGGTKIAGAAFDAQGREILQVKLPTPSIYEELVGNCRAVVAELESKAGKASSIGGCSPYCDDEICANVPSLIGKDLSADLSRLFGIKVPFGNDANCAALAEAMEGAGKGYSAVFGLILGTGVGGGFVLNGQMLAGANGLAGEIGHLPLPYYEASDGPLVECGCGQKGCIDKLAAGAALSRLYQKISGQMATARVMTEAALRGEADALKALDQYYTIVAKAMVTVIHAFDPEIITVSGGLNGLPGLYEEVPKRWGRYLIARKPRTKFVPATFGAVAGLRGAAWLGKRLP